MKEIKIYLTSEEARKILEAEGEVEVSLDLGISIEKVVVGKDKAIIRGVEVSFDTLRKLKEGRVYFFTDSFYEASIADKNYYKLVPTGDMPTIEISGIRMHRTKGATPGMDTASKIRSLGEVKGRVLDTCFGLGYTSLFALKYGASEVVAVERDERVLKLAEINPYSRELFRDKRFKVIHGDVFEVIKSFGSEEFDAVVHDPPRFSRAGRLYSLEFYSEIYRVLKMGGKLFHYVGSPGARYRGKDLARGVMERLREAGFSEVKRAKEALGVVAVKGR